MAQRPVDEEEKHEVILPDTAEICAFRYGSPAFRVFGTHTLEPRSPAGAGGDRGRSAGGGSCPQAQAVNGGPAPH